MKSGKPTQSTRKYVVGFLSLSAAALTLGGAMSQTEFLRTLFYVSRSQEAHADAGGGGASISPARARALVLFTGVTGVSIPIDDSRLLIMEPLIAAGNEADAVKIATADANFYNIRVADMFRKISTREENILAPLSDLVATGVGVVRDGINAKELLTGNFTYQMDPALGYTYDASGNAQAMIGLPPSPDGKDLINLAAPKFLNMMIYNDYYRYIESLNLSLFNVLTRVNGQLVLASRDVAGGGIQGNPVPNPDPAGMLSTRAWSLSTETAGTNRRAIEYSFREFMCTPMANMADASMPDDHVGRDVDRSPGGNPAVYQTTCKACHAVMDGFRPAYAHYDFGGPNNTMAIAYYPLYHVDSSLNPIPMNADRGPGNSGGTIAGPTDGKGYPNWVAYKLNKMTAGNSDAFQEPLGYPVTNNKWVNYATNSLNANQFGWRGPASGEGLAQFGALLAGSFGFSKCMVRRVFTEVCMRAPDIQAEMPLIESLAKEFEAKGYLLRNLFEKVAIQPACLGSLN